MAKEKKQQMEKFMTPVFRVSFPHVFEPAAMEEGQKKRYSVQAIWTPAEMTPDDKVRFKKMVALLEKASQDKHKKPWKDLAPDKRGLRNGKEKAELAGLGEGTYFANLTSNSRPGVIHVRKDSAGNFIKISPEEGNADEIYPGCYARATFNVYAYDNKSKGTAIGLGNLQKVKDGERLDNRTRAEDDFADAEVDEEWLEGQDDMADGDLDDEIPF